MGAGGVTNHGSYKVYGKIGDLKVTGKPNSRIDLYNSNGVKIQSRWYGPDGKAVRNRDYKHGGNLEFPHDHIWNWSNSLPRGKEHIAPDYKNFK